MSSVWDMILQWGSTIKVSTELPVATRHRRDMTEKLLNVTLNPNSRNATSEKWVKVFTRRHHARHNIILQYGGHRNEQKYIKRGPFVFGLQLVTTCIYADFISFVIFSYWNSIICEWVIIPRPGPKTVIHVPSSTETRSRNTCLSIFRNIDCLQSVFCQHLHKWFVVILICFLAKPFCGTNSLSLVNRSQTWDCFNCETSLLEAKQYP